MIIGVAMTNNIRVHKRQSSQATELFITALSPAQRSLDKQAEHVFSQIVEILHTHQAYLFQERIFGTEVVIPILAKVRKKVYGDLDDGVIPSYLICKRGMQGDFIGVQIHAVTTKEGPQRITGPDGITWGRMFRTRDSHYLGLSAVAHPCVDNPEQQAHVMFDTAREVLEAQGSGFMSVPRTWLWLRDILDWYPVFNKVRNTVFTQYGILGRGTRAPMPASTGIGLGLHGGAACAMDLTAVLQPSNTIEYMQAGGNQECAFTYGSAFSRAACAPTPAGKTVFISGTAAIDSQGNSTHIGDARAQIQDTLFNVQAVLKDMDCQDRDVVQVMAYCKTPEVEEIFREIRLNMTWPWITVICDICRPELLFEVEVTAMPMKF